MTETFTYQNKWDRRTMTSVVSRAVAERIADAIKEARLGDYPFLKQEESVPNETREERAARPDRWELCPGVVAVVAEAGLERGGRWWLDVDAVLHQRREEEARLARLEACRGASPHPAVVAYLLARAEAPQGRFEPRSSSLSWMAEAARRGPRPYAGQRGCSMRMRLKEAVHFLNRQESWADHAEWVVPVLGEPGDEAVCRSNLARFAESLRTTNGMAGVGSSYSFSLLPVGDGWVVVIDQRSSIAD